MESIITLSELLNAAKAQYHVYELGRKVQYISNEEFENIESLTTPYPFPIQGHAQFALLFWDSSNQQYIWFLKLPLDEQGLINPAGRSQFIQMLLEAMGNDLTQELSEAQQQQMANHPFSFKPSQEKLAVFNALVRQKLSQGMSSQFAFAHKYLTGNIDADKWSELGIQGLADICVHANEPEYTNLISHALGHSVTEVQTALCQLLEHIQIDNVLAAAIFHQFKLAPAIQKPYLLRALSSQPALCIDAINIIEQPLDAEMLITIAARCWSVLNDDTCRKNYLESLSHQPQDFFNQIFTDIVAIPSIRVQLLGELRNPNRSEQLSNAIGGLFKAYSS